MNILDELNKLTPSERIGVFRRCGKSHFLMELLFQDIERKLIEARKNPSEAYISLLNPKDK